MADSRPIQALAPGYLGLLGLKNMGQLPEVARDSVQPIIDMVPFYGAALRKAIQFVGLNIPAGTTGFFGFEEPERITVPENRVWVVQGGEFMMTANPVAVVSARANLAVGSYGNFQADRALSESVGWGDPTTVAVATVQATFATVPLMIGSVLLPGDFLFCNVNFVHGAGDVVPLGKITIADFPL